KDGVGQVIKAFVTVGTLIALTGRFRVIKAALDHLLRLTRGTLDAIRPAQLTNRPITLHIIDEIRDVDLHGWTPVRDRGIGWRQYTPSSHATTLESKKSDQRTGCEFCAAQTLLAWAKVEGNSYRRAQCGRKRRCWPLVGLFLHGGVRTSVPV